MKVNPNIQNIINNDVDITAFPKVVAEWNLNRYGNPVVRNYPQEDLEGFDTGLFPINSIVEPNRPHQKGILKARTGYSIFQEQNTRRPNSAGTVFGKFYICDVDDPYKYWTSPLPCVSGQVVGANSAWFPAENGIPRDYTDTVSVAPQVIYDKAYRANKIVVKFENTWASPSIFYIQVTQKANPNPNVTSTDWTTVAAKQGASEVGMNTGWQNTGVIESYYNGNGTTLGGWTGTKTISKSVNVRGVRVLVYEVEPGFERNLNGALIRTKVGKEQSNVPIGDAYVDIIELGARLEEDLSSHVISVSSSMSMSEPSPLVPLGGLNKNQCEIEFSNLVDGGVYEGHKPGLFSNYNNSSPYAGLLDANVELRISYDFYKDGVHQGNIPYGVVYSDVWSGQETDVVSVSCDDYSKFFEEGGLEAQPSLWENLSVTEIACRLLDSIGFNNYVVNDWDQSYASQVIPIFHVSKDSSIFETLNSLAIAGQVAMFFDSDGAFQIREKEYAFKPTAPAAWTFSSANKSEFGGTGLADLLSLTEDSLYEPNKYTINYTPKKWAEYSSNDILTKEIVWEPEGTLVLRSSPLTERVPSDAQAVNVGSSAESWPFEGVLNIDGEYISYKGKWYAAYHEYDFPDWVKVESLEDVYRVNAATPPSNRGRNRYTGHLVIKERGIWGSKPRIHELTQTWARKRQSSIAGGGSVPMDGSVFTMNNSKAHLNTLHYPAKTFTLAQRGDVNSRAFTRLGTRVMFDKTSSPAQQEAGIAFNLDGSSQNGGYFLSLKPSRITDKTKGMKAISLKSRVKSGSSYIEKELASVAHPVVEGVENEIDVRFNEFSGFHQIIVMIDGVRIMNVKVTSTSSGKISHKPSSLSGIFAMGSTRASFEYFYGSDQSLDAGSSADVERDTQFTAIMSGNLGSFHDKVNILQGAKTKRKSGAKRTYPLDIIDDFGPYVHEVREFDVSFENPVQSSQLGLYNTWAAVCIEYVGNPFGAKFILANSARFNAVISGEDSIAFPSEPVTVPFHIYGRIIVNGDAKEIEVRNDSQIRRRGVIESVIDSEWVQTEEMANDLGKWLNTQWSSGSPSCTVEVVGNPLIDLGDVVRVYYPERFIDGYYYVVGINASFNEGLTTSVMLRKRITSS